MDDNEKLLEEALNKLAYVERALAKLKLPDPQTPRGSFLHGLTVDATSDISKAQEDVKQVKEAVELIFAIILANAPK